MSQKVQIYKNTNKKSTGYGKYYVRAVYDGRFITTQQLADFIQTQCTVKRSDCKAVLDELGSAIKHFFELGQKIKIDNVGILKVGVSSRASDTKSGCTASNVRSAHVVFSPETVSIPNGESHSTRRASVDGTVSTYYTKGYDHPVVMLKDVRFELAQGDSASSAQEPVSGGEG